MSGDKLSEFERRVKNHMDCLDEAGAGEYTEWLFPWAMGYSRQEQADYATAYFRLGSVNIMVGHNATSGMANTMTEWVVRNEVPAYLEAHNELRSCMPVGLHRIRTSRDDALAVLRFKFPDQPPPLCMRPGGKMDIYLGPAAVLQRDWYLNGSKVRRLCPDDPPEVILRSPLRNRHDAASVAHAIFDALSWSRPGNHCFGPTGAAALAGELTDIAETLQKARGYPVNLAEIYRHLESVRLEGMQLNEPLRTGLAEAIAGYARSVMERTAWNGDEAARIRMALFPEKAS